MAYTLISEKHDIWGCKLEDLTLEVVLSMMKDFKLDDSLETLAIFIGTDRGELVLNVNHEKYEKTLENVLAFFEDTEERREAYAKKHPDSILAAAKRYREAIREADIIKNRDTYHRTDFGFGMTWEMQKGLEMIGGNRTPFLMFRYGFIQGKRAERARRKRGRSK